MCMCNLLCMNGWNYICMYDETYVLLNSPVKYIYICHICAVKILGFTKKQKKEPICRLFAVRHRRQWALCRLPRTAKKTRGI